MSIILPVYQQKLEELLALDPQEQAEVNLDSVEDILLEIKKYLSECNEFDRSDVHFHTVNKLVRQVQEEYDIEFTNEWMEQNSDMFFPNRDHGDDEGFDWAGFGED